MIKSKLCTCNCSVHFINSVTAENRTLEIIIIKIIVIKRFLK